MGTAGPGEVHIQGGSLESRAGSVIDHWEDDTAGVEAHTLEVEHA